MKFYTYSNQERPKRLCEKTREFAYRSLNHKYGLDTLKNRTVSLDHIENFCDLSDLEKYNAAIYEIATKAPVRICEGERISGAATLGDAIYHRVPAVYKGETGEYLDGISHFTADFSEVLKIGMDGIRQKAEKSLKKHTDPSKIQFLESCIHCIDCMKIWHGRYMAELCRLGGYEDNIKNLSAVPFGKATSFYEAVQSIWFSFSYLRLCGCWPGIGRIDVLLGEYLKTDLEKGILTIDEAREILAHFFIKGCEWITGLATVSGDAQHYQNLVLSGIDEDGNDVTNEVTYLVLDIIEETGISDFPTTVRINANTDPKLLRRVSEVIMCGGGVVAVYNEDLILRALDDMGYDKREARCFANDGCWEVQIPGKTWFSYDPFDSLAILQKVTLGGYEKEIVYNDFESLLQSYERDLEKQVKEIFERKVLRQLENDRQSFKRGCPCTVVSLFEQPCIEKGLSYHEGGTEYVVVSPHIGGLPDAVNSLYAIKKAVFDDKIISFTELMEILGNNWEGNEELRRRILSTYTYYGNDNDEVDSIAAKLLGDFSDMCRKYDGQTPIRFVSGVSTFGRQIEWASRRLASPFGRKAGEVLSGNLSPTPGTDETGATSIIKSYCKADLSKQHTGAALDIGFIPVDSDNERNAEIVSGLIKSFVSLGGFFMQIDTVDKSVLLEAQKNPENYQTLSVRVSGWSARFVTMSKEWQDMIIDRTN